MLMKATKKAPQVIKDQIEKENNSYISHYMLLLKHPKIREEIKKIFKEIKI